MDHTRRSGHTQRLTQEGGLLAVALHQMNRRAWPARESTSENHSRKSAAASEIHPNLRGRSEIQQLQRIRDVPAPKLRQRRRRNEIGLRLPRPEQIEEAIQPRLCFT